MDFDSFVNVDAIKNTLLREHPLLVYTINYQTITLLLLATPLISLLVYLETH